MKIVKHIANCVDLDGEALQAFGTLAEILEVDWVASWKSRARNGHRFRRYSRSRSGDLLVVEHGTIEQDGHEYPAHWWVVANVTEPDADFNKLPEARYPKRQ